MHQKNDFFLKHAELPKGFELSWAMFNHRLEIVKLSEALYSQVKKPIASILKQPMSATFPTLELTLIDLTNRTTKQLLHFIDERGHAQQVIIVPIDDSADHWCMVLTQLDLDEKWLMDLHPDYNLAIQSSDDWLQQIEAVITAKSDVVFKTALQQALALTHSQVGYLHIYDEKHNKIVRTAWTDKVKQFFAISDNQQYLADSGLWAETIKTKQATIDNDPLDNSVRLQRDGYFAFNNHLCVPIRYRKKVVGIIGVGNRDKPFTQVDAKSLAIYATILWHCVELPRTINAMSKQSVIIKDQKEKMTHILVQLVGAISEALELKDAYTAGHQKSVAQLSYLMGEKMGLPADQLEGLKLGALIHDIGKLAIPSQILAKPSRLTAIEYELVKQHPVQGALIVDEVEFPWPIKQMILQHHERLDGSGYPSGLKEKDIIIEAKIIAVADVADSILSHRPYRPSMGMAALNDVLIEGRGKIFDAHVVDACLDILAIHDLKTAEYVGSLSLDPAVTIEEYHTLEHTENMLNKAKMQVAVVLSEQNRLPIGVIDKKTLAFWRSPFLDTAAERLVDRSLLNKRAHQIMDHKINIIAANTILKDAKILMEKNNTDYLVVQNIDNQVIGIVTWKILANALMNELDEERSMQS
ncbi:HD domain-containing phosphohydrolase [Shewanella glacialimarina]|uniref:HD domain-containing phosphohydrolase n=1 Tax=Shewanella glacialimarina TaxID=2590884 RepID=UPI001CF92804|nr:HD domain-containing phosphohydrolase [Shewanella glacialimarina]UCX05172.1 HD domain-containing protein [Shewanella glacialimarina]